MSLPPLLILPGEPEYRASFHADYVSQAHFTFDHIRVHFHAAVFDHAFFESTNYQQASKDAFSRSRAERMPWIAATLADPSALVLAGWLKRTKNEDHTRRVAVAGSQYVVIVRLRRVREQADFMTAFPLNPATRAKILQSPAWDRSKCGWQR